MPSEIFINTFSFSIIQNFFIKKWIFERLALPLCSAKSPIFPKFCSLK